MGWLNGFQNRQSFQIGTIATAVEGYPIEFQIHAGSGMNSGTKIYCPGCKDDFSDIRFTKSDGITLLNQWRRSFSSGSVAKFFVRFPTVSGSEFLQHYVYWESEGAVLRSDPHSVLKDGMILKAITLETLQQRVLAGKSRALMLPT